MPDEPTIGAELDAIKLDVQMSRRKIAALPPQERWALEDAASEIQSIVRAINDDELRRWVEKGETQDWIARQIGRSVSQVNRRVIALGLTPKSNRGRPRISPAGNSEATEPTPPPADEPEELVQGEVVDGDPAPEPIPMPKPRGKVPCPTCGNPVDVRVLSGE